MSFTRLETGFSKEQRPTHTQSAFDTDFPFAHLKFNLDCFSIFGISYDFAW